MRMLFAIALACAFASSAAAEWKAEYADQPKEVQDWYRNAELTPAASARLHGWKSCCAHSDVVKTTFKANERGDEWYWRDGEKWRRVPDDIIHWGESAPGGQPTLFVYKDTETCFYPPDGGI